MDETEQPVYGGAFNPFSRELCELCGWRGGHSLDCAVLNEPSEPIKFDEDGNLKKGQIFEPVTAKMKQRAAVAKPPAGSKPKPKPKQSEVDMLLGKSPSEIGTSSSSSVKTWEKPIAPDMAATGAKSIKPELSKCVTCKIKIPESDIPGYKAEKKCPFSRDGCPFVVGDIEDTTGCKKEEASAVTMDTSFDGYADICGDGSVMKKIEKQGTGTICPEKGHYVTVDYVGKLFPSGKQFDSSRDRGERFSFPARHGIVIPGWVDAVCTMKRGEVASFVLQSKKGYGSRGSPPKIPPNAVLFFEIELYEWRDLQGKLQKEPHQEEEEVKQEQGLLSSILSGVTDLMFGSK